MSLSTMDGLRGKGGRTTSAMHHTLFYLIAEEKVRQITALLEKGCNVNIQNSHLQTPLMKAIYMKQADVRMHVVRLLLSKKCNINAQDQWGQTALMVAAFEKNREDVIRKIISTGDCDPNIEDLRGDTALMHAVYGDNPAAIRVMVNSAYTKNIIHVNKQNETGLCPLMLAYKLRQKDCLQVLINEGRADTGVLKENGRSVLKYINDEDAHETQRKAEKVKVKSNMKNNTGPMFPSLVPQRIDLQNKPKIDSVGKLQSQMLDKVFGFNKDQERLHRKRKHKKKKNMTRTVHINVTEPTVGSNKSEDLRPNLTTSGTNYAKNIETQHTQNTHVPSPSPIRYLENDNTKFNRLDPHLFKPNLMTLSDSRISAQRGNHVTSFGSTRDMRMTRDVSGDFPTSFSLNDKSSTTLNKLAPLPPIFPTALEGKKKTLPALHPRE